MLRRGGFSIFEYVHWLLDLSHHRVREQMVDWLCHQAVKVSGPLTSEIAEDTSYLCGQIIKQNVTCVQYL